MDKERIYATKCRNYFQGARPDIVELIPKEAGRLLELGCGEGYTLLSARQQGKASEIVGIDIIPRCTTHDQLDFYLQGDLDTLTIPYPEEYFDVIICADVLEHLVDPWTALHRLVRLLRSGGTLIASIPNARDYTLAASLLCKGSFTYRTEGLLDKGHLRFFCKKDMDGMIREAGLQAPRYVYKLEKLRKLLFFASFGLLEQFLVKQYLLISTKP